MAESLVGLLTSAVVGIAKDKLTSTIAEQANFLWNFGDDLEDMNSVLESISAALQDAERRSAKDNLVQLWLKRLKHAAIDISDMLEDYRDTSERLTAKKPGMLSCLTVSRKKIAVANRINSTREELMKINKDFRDFNFTQGCTSTSDDPHYDARETSSLLPENPIIGRNREKQDIIKLLLASDNDETVIVPIYGLGGMGKSTLAQLVYNDAHFKRYDYRIWVYVSRQFSLKKIGSSIISQLPVEGIQQNWDTLQLINQCLDNQLHGKKVLIVLDDLWEEKDTELGKLRSMLKVGKKGIVIDVIVTTRNEDIARKVSTCNEPYKLQPLKVDTCWEIIKRLSKFADKHNQERLEQIGLNIAKKCGGVALAAQALGYMLQSKDLSGWTEINNSDIWNESSENGDGVLPSLKLSYEWMSPQLRICFSYCAIFPKGHNIPEDDLIHQWIALDFIKTSKGKEYIRQLLGMSFLQVPMLPNNTSGEYMALYTMHDLVHDLATLVVGDELIVSDVALKKNNTHGQKYCCYALVTKYDQETKLSNILPSKTRALHFSDSGKLDLACGAFSFAKYLRILDFSGCSSILLPASIGQMKQLKYLIAPRMRNECLPEYVTMLPKLQYLNLNGSSHISTLPESICSLGCLKYLCLSGCSGISKLPESFGDLKCMMHLDMSGCSGIRELPNSLGNLKNLQRLELSECSGVKVIPESLCGLTQLQYLNLSSCYIARLPGAIGNLMNLQYLNMSRCGIKKLPESFRRLCNLLHLDLEYTCIKKGLPEALRGLNTLQYLDMSRVQYVGMDLLPAGAMRNLSNLKVLNLSSSLSVLFGAEKNDSCLDFIGTLTNLEHLDISWNYRLEYLPESIGNLKRLHTLNLEGCRGLKSLPQSIGCATGLKSVFLDGCSHELMDQAGSILHYSLTLPLFKVRADDVNAHSNMHLLEGEDMVELHIVSLENVRSVEEAERLKLLTKHNLLTLELAWSSDVDRHLEDKDLLGQLVPPMSLKDLSLEGYGSPIFPSWLMDSITHHLPNLMSIALNDLPACSNLPPLGQLPYLESLRLLDLPRVTKLDGDICGGKGAFPRLANFRVACMEGLEEWNTTYPGEDDVEEFMFPMLDTLEVYDCPRLRLKSCPPKCRKWTIQNSNQVIFSLEEVQTSNHRCNSTPITTSLAISRTRQHHSFRLFHHFPALQELDLYRCPNLTSLPEGIQQLSSLQLLELAWCQSISALPEWLNDISSLKRLVIKHCRSIKSLPACIQQLTNLEQLDIYGNHKLKQWCELEENKPKLAHIKIMYT